MADWEEHLGDWWTLSSVEASKRREQTNGGREGSKYGPDVLTFCDSRDGDFARH